ncbi:FecR domain-containing protein [Pseudomonas guariconensis]|uniref:FecR family protein n=1 Tax=Pseudomonas TaxID=286 RepID=UPI001CE41082|nr:MULTISPECIES: FecR domain-containing protein [Pseudomonas]MCO7638033.1 FecR domain-containing protein [Pseudomonas sp. S 311-6]MCO7516613.1 FecR domain-containing protein [Pseudomonas putida]MCO7566271.1 FecR domain-containing protein [Pseudomonas mosselii]MCO7592996.1 FecR domain-containing protein [Pseudomonas guariconensis]MCO7606927.1 FecR domain-containing protein [Pseudomonas guariconensis]
MTDSPVPRPSPAGPDARARAMDEALDWLVRLQCASEDDTRAFEAWLSAAPENAEAYVEAEALWNGAPLRQAASHLHHNRRRSLGGRLRAHWKPLATAAVLLVGLFTFGNLPVRLQADHLTVVGERQRLQLDDGAQVLLNTNSAFASDLREGRQVARLLQGEAYFQVPGGIQAPLEVQAGPLRAQVHDTDFAVRYLDGQAQVRVQRGDVDLQAASDQRIRLSAGDSISVGPQGFSQRQRPDMSKELAWIDGRLVFENCPLSQVLDELRRYYPGWIISRNTQLEQVAVTGNYRLDQPLETLRALAQITSAQLHEYPALVIIN